MRELNAQDLKRTLDGNDQLLIVLRLAEIKPPCLSLEQMILERVDVFCHAGVVNVIVKQHPHQAHVMKLIMMDSDCTNLEVTVNRFFISFLFQIIDVVVPQHLINYINYQIRSSSYYSSPRNTRRKQRR